ncbi:5-(carboxyamino)imidazole ribonucleotide synthase [Chitinilyticum piscinae]|uniref:N5-carboxyaminoimidazole ribonucleotide synthase n=1 Tax=Chitinilyticum piscinae TaxID=2866724 RepID=A0A8J7FJL9_9NEIS|nr:5-(carboxyamino)imidazole ribonucleotide synthase [Chitinilyticum piscinae]MBE9608009.1 5-(carboxyamino)imidazole ribonucleotide synthase [Chitinilyticum piscinae]
MTKPLTSPILPPAMLGILGGGQLGRMFATAAKTMGYRVTVLDPDASAPAADFADVHLCKPYTDRDALQQLVDTCAAITTEFENVNADSMRWLAEQGLRVSPSGDCVAIAQDRIAEKTFIRNAGLATAPFLAILNAGDLPDDLSPYLPGILKTARLGYDGKGQVRVKTPEDVRYALSELKHQPCVLEKMLPLVSEVSVIVTRSRAGEVVSFPPAENEHANGILDVSIVPARIADAVTARARDMAMTLAEKLDYVGVLAVEFFVLEGDELVINEMAPRPHNSGHYTLDATLTTQFEQQVRAMCGLYPGRTELLKPVVMVNLLGDVWGEDGSEPNWEILMTAPNSKLHLYGKKEARVGRKMGHFNVLAEDANDALEQARAIMETLGNQRSES